MDNGQYYPEPYIFAVFTPPQRKSKTQKQNEGGGWEDDVYKPLCFLQLSPVVVVFLLYTQSTTNLFITK